ncbi:MAG: chloride channel protein [Thiothrix sp.]|nr:chloride channel protein [Thiothrix sp.]
MLDETKSVPESGPEPDSRYRLRQLPGQLAGWLDRLRLRLANPEALLLLSLLAVVTGLLTGLIIVLFRLLITWLHAWLLPSGLPEDFESLSALMRLGLPLVGAGLLILLFTPLTASQRQVGVVYLIERLHYYQGRLHSINALTQFLGALISLGFGFSVGREGPSVHMGGYGGSWLAQRLQLPNNSNRTLIACGVAAAIGASFNTPLAGIIFAMEVIMQQYTVQGFAPVILAAVSGTYLSRVLVGEELFFSIQLLPASNYEWPLIGLLGISIGALSAGFNFALIHITRLGASWPFWLRFLLAGSAMGMIGWWMPQSMGTGYDTIDQVMNGQLGLTLLSYILIAKLLATLLCLGLGIPGGVIGPLMFIGSVAGGVVVITMYSSSIGVLIPHDPKLYPLLGMGAMFAASLQAPLAGLTAVMELAGNESIVLPAMLAIVTASLTSKVIFHHDSLFRSLLRARGLDHSSSPVVQRLHMIGAASIMNRSFILCERQLSRNAASLILHRGNQWLVLTGPERKPEAMVQALEVQRFMEAHPEAETIDLSDIPGKYLKLVAISFRASLQDVMESLNASGVEAVYLQREQERRIYGVITRTQIAKAYL